MSTFRNNTKTKSINKTVKPDPISEPPKPVATDDIELAFEEARYLLSLIAKTDFSGKDVQIVYNIAVKLQSIIKNNLTEDNVNI